MIFKYVKIIRICRKESDICLLMKATFLNGLIIKCMYKTYLTYPFFKEGKRLFCRNVRRKQLLCEWCGADKTAR